MLKDITEYDASVEQVLQEAAIPTQTQVTPEAPPPPPKEEVIEVEAEEEKETKKEQPQQYDEATINATTDIVIGLLDGTQSTVFRILTERKKNKKLLATGGNGAIARLQQLKAAEHNKETLLEDTDLKLLDIDATVEDFLNNLSFDDNTKDMMREPLKILVAKNMGKMPPEFMLFLALATGIGKNIAGYYSL